MIEMTIVVSIGNRFGSVQQQNRNGTIPAECGAVGTDQVALHS
jgi:hypothetical protein